MNKIIKVEAGNTWGEINLAEKSGVNGDISWVVNHTGVLLSVSNNGTNPQVFSVNFENLENLPIGKRTMPEGSDNIIITLLSAD
jgi:hypothetical protein